MSNKDVFDVTNQPHYARFKIQPMDFVVANDLGWFAGNIVKYASRAPYKGQLLSDIRKIIDYARRWEKHERAQAGEVRGSARVIRGPDVIISDKAYNTWEETVAAAPKPTRRHALGYTVNGVRFISIAADLPWWRRAWQAVVSCRSDTGPGSAS